MRAAVLDVNVLFPTLKSGLNHESTQMDTNL